MEASSLLDRAIAEWKNGQTDSARKQFKFIVLQEPTNQRAWGWYIQSLATGREKIVALRAFLDVFPGNQKGMELLAKLEGTENTPAVSLPPALAVLPRRQTSAASPQKPLPQVKNPSLNPNLPLPLLTLVVFGILCVCITSSGLAYSIYSMAQENQSLAQANRQAALDNAVLRNNIQTLESQNQLLFLDNQSLNSKNAALSSEIVVLQASYQTLESDHNALLEKYNLLSGEHTALEKIAITPPYILVHDRKVDTTFYDLNQQLITWSTPFVGLENSILNGSSLRRQIVQGEAQTRRVYTLNNQVLWLRDYSDFVTPDTFRNVIPELYRKSASPYEFINLLWYMSGQLSNYASESIETPRYPLETLLAGGGDCEDLSILLASMVRAAPVNWYVDLVYVDSKNINNPQHADHVVVIISTGQETFIVETTSDKTMLPYTQGVTGWLASDLDSQETVIYPRHLP